MVVGIAEQIAAAEQHLVALQQLYQQEGQLSAQALRHPRMLQLLLSGVCIRQVGICDVELYHPGPPAQRAPCGAHVLAQCCMHIGGRGLPQ
jgi:hypothetical protein